MQKVSHLWKYPLQKKQLFMLNIPKYKKLMSNHQWKLKQEHNFNFDIFVGIIFDVRYFWKFSLRHGTSAISNEKIGRLLKDTLSSFSIGIGCSTESEIEEESNFVDDANCVSTMVINMFHKADHGMSEPVCSQNRTDSQMIQSRLFHREILNIRK